MLIQFGGSLLAILVLAALVWAMRLGGKPLLAGDADVARAAGEAVDGFEPVRSSIARGGEAALARDTHGRIMLIKRHGNKFAGRVLTSSATVCEEVDALVIRCGPDADSARFGAVRLALDDPAYWADAINRL